MNIFYLDHDPVLAAQYQCDKHVVKMILESAQLLCTTHWELNTGIPYTNKVKFYKSTHKNHPCAKWSRDCQCNYNWLAQHALALCHEYTYRYNRIHVVQPTIQYCIDNVPQFQNVTYCIQKPALAMPKQYYNEDPVQAYRDYYWYDKRVNIQCQWNKARKPPQWWLDRITQNETS